ncbi:hypothetical protein SLE2022_054960 [Rubroshorea leprosula]
MDPVKLWGLIWMSEACVGWERKNFKPKIEMKRTSKCKAKCCNHKQNTQGNSATVRDENDQNNSISLLV